MLEFSDSLGVYMPRKYVSYQYTDTPTQAV